MIQLLDVLEPVDAHQVVGRYLNPARAEDALAPRPETLPASQVHSMGEMKGEALEW